jgi:Na+-translocating ferredoxin:NAD+ oxidoreductase RnfG subunit
MTPNELIEKRQANIKKALKASNTTNILKGLNTFVSHKSKQAEQKNRLINQLLKNGMYQNIYNKYCDYLEETEADNIDILLDKYISNKELKILEIFKFCEPDELDLYKDGFNIQMIPINI